MTNRRSRSAKLIAKSKSYTPKTGGMRGKKSSSRRKAKKQNKRVKSILQRKEVGTSLFKKLLRTKTEDPLVHAVLSKAFNLLDISQHKRVNEALNDPLLNVYHIIYLIEKLSKTDLTSELQNEGVDVSGYLEYLNQSKHIAHPSNNS